jgi:uncharacterized repeat protein (TIGR03803 family)
MQRNRMRLNYMAMALLLVGVDAAQAGSYTVLSSFTGADGASPNMPLISDSAGNFYGTTAGGGNTACPGGCGIVFKLSPSGELTVVYSFTGGADGSKPLAGLTLGPDGSFYGTNSEGGPNGGSYGVVYKVDASGTFLVLHAFTGGADGGQPSAPVVLDAAGNVYGTAAYGAEGGCELVGCGVVFEIDTAGRFRVLHSFTGQDGGIPFGGVILDAAGNLYGTTEFGGSSGLGVVFRIDVPKAFKVLYTFSGGTDGANPAAGVTLGSKGNLYGTTSYGGADNAGTVYELDPEGNLTLLHTFTGGADGGTPAGGVFVDSKGNVYGTAEVGGSAESGVLYEVNTAGTFAVLHNFTGAGGAGPAATPMGIGNYLYGATAAGGAANDGVIFKFQYRRPH